MLANAKDPNYKPMTPHCNGIEFQAAVDIIFKGKDIPTGYTEGLLISAHRTKWIQGRKCEGA